MQSRIALGVEYDGTDFVGWQTQANGRSVQALVTAAASRVADEPVTLVAAGRTDAGVHAAGQVVHFDTGTVRSARQWVLGINSNLPEDVGVSWAMEVAPDFDARRSAVSRRYRYLLMLRGTRAVLARRRVWWLREPVSCAAMSRAAAAWLGERDFSAFRAAGCQSRTPMRCLMAVSIRRHEELVALDFTANAFLHHMVRNLVGTLVEIGQGKAPPSWAAELLAARDRTRAGATAPARGLTLMEVTYPKRHGVPVATDPWPSAP